MIDHPMRGRGPAERNLSSITSALSRVRELALVRATDPKNETKPHWLMEHPLILALKVAEESGELIQAVMRNDVNGIDHEAGDLVWAVAILVDALRHNRREADEGEEA